MVCHAQACTGALTAHQRPCLSPQAVCSIGHACSLWLVSKLCLCAVHRAPLTGQGSHSCGMSPCMASFPYRSGRSCAPCPSSLQRNPSRTGFLCIRHAPAEQSKGVVMLAHNWHRCVASLGAQEVVHTFESHSLLRSACLQARATCLLQSAQRGSHAGHREVSPAWFALCLQASSCSLFSRLVMSRPYLLSC